MRYLLIPHDVSPRTATVWVGVLGGGALPAQLEIRSQAASQPLTGPWQSWQAAGDGNRVDYLKATLSGLQPRTAYALSLVGDGQLLADSKLTTLPERMPTAADKPFTVLLGSCFCLREDEEAAVGGTYARIPAAARPDVKLLTGDQVYLDSPWDHYLKHSHSRKELEIRHFTNYRKTWTQEAGFQALLKDGANYFCSDDHEFWNNAPNRAVFIQDTWPLLDRRDDWKRAARGLYEAFQCGSLTASFGVAPVSFFIADTRIERQADQSTFMRAADLDALGGWVEGLEGPGVLAVGQPIFQARTGISGNWSDWSLPDFKQYGPLVRLLARSRHALVVVTGDVHFGRIARCNLGSDAELIEIIASPLSLVDKNAEGKWQEAPEVFPAFELSGMPKKPVVTEAFKTNRAHFLTLEFVSHGAGVRLQVRHWPILKNQSVPDGRFGATVWERTLQ